MSDNKEFEKIMIDFIEKKEKEIPVDKLEDAKTKSEMVNAILDKLEKVMGNEN